MRFPYCELPLYILCLFFYRTVFWLICFLSLQSFKRSLCLSPLPRLSFTLQPTKIQVRPSPFQWNVLPKISSELLILNVMKDFQSYPGPCSTISTYTLLLGLHNHSPGVPSLDLLLSPRFPGLGPKPLKLVSLLHSCSSVHTLSTTIFSLATAFHPRSHPHQPTTFTAIWEMNPWLQFSRGIPQPQGFCFARHYLARDVTNTKPLTAAKCAKLSSHSSNGSSMPSFPCGNHHQEGHPNPCTLQFPNDITAKTDHLLRCPAPAPCTGILGAQ